MAVMVLAEVIVPEVLDQLPNVCPVLAVAVTVVPLMVTVLLDTDMDDPYGTLVIEFLSTDPPVPAVKDTVNVFNVKFAVTVLDDVIEPDVLDQLLKSYPVMAVAVTVVPFNVMLLSDTDIVEPYGAVIKLLDTDPCVESSTVKYTV